MSIQPSRPARVNASTPSQALLVKLAARPDFTAIEAMPRGAERKAAAWEALKDTAATSQAPFVQLAQQLKDEGKISSFETMVSPNMVIVSPVGSHARTVQQAFATEGVQAIYRNGSASEVWTAAGGHQAATGASNLTENPWGLDDEPGIRVVAPPTERPYGLDQIGAPKAWQQGATGKGLVYGSIDTGVDPEHEAIRSGYRGRAADGTVNHDYNWADFAGSAKPVPFDDNGHGTHTIGTVTGAGIGVAPEAKWVAVRGLGTGADSALRALQWMQAPTRVDGTQADPTQAPDVVGMSWWMGSSREELFRDSIQNLRAAGIEPVKSAGNKGPGDSTISSPGHHPELLATAAVDKAGKVASFSSRGPSLIPVDNPTPKPDFAAPGVDTISSVPGNRYGAKSGTSMAQPHMSGTLLAILSKHPHLTHDQLVQVLASTAVDAGAAGHDREYGHGIVNIPAALAAVAQLSEQRQAA